jgi:hypothetical protein
MAGPVMSQHIKKAAEIVAQNVLLQAVSRAAMALSLPVIAWAASEILSLEKRMTASETTQSMIAGRLATIEESARAGAASDGQAAASVAVLTAGQQHTLQMLGVITDNLRRLERRLDDYVIRSANPHASQ